MATRRPGVITRALPASLALGLLAPSGSALAQAEDAGPRAAIPDDDWTTRRAPAVPDDWTTPLAASTSAPDSGAPPPTAPASAPASAPAPVETDLSIPLPDVPPIPPPPVRSVLSAEPDDYEAPSPAPSKASRERASEATATSTSEVHFVLSFPVGAMNGFASHPGQEGTTLYGLLGGYAPYSSTIYGLGISLGVLFEGEQYGIGADLAGFAGASGASAYIDIHGLLYLTPDSTAPFVGGGIGFLANTVLFICGGPSPPPDGAGPMADAELGVEFGRHSSSHLRVQLSLQGLIPFYSDGDGSYPLGLLFTTRIAF